MAPVSPQPLIGGHVSCAGGPLKALERAQELEFPVMQIHPSAPQTWAKPTVTDETAAQFKATAADFGVQATFFHNVYLCNFASPNPAGWHASITITTHYLSLATKMGALGAVTHVGSHKGAGMAEVLPRVVEGLRKTLEASSSDVYFLIENTAGGGGTIGRSLEEIQMITDELWKHHKNVGICIDTCHAFAAGIPVHTNEGLESFLREFDERFGLDALKCIHLNDTKLPFGSHRDRHANIGEGEMGTDGLRPFLTHPKLRSVPFLLEVPGLENAGPDRPNRERALAIAQSV
jgi:deoxyribonuclease IV